MKKNVTLSSPKKERMQKNGQRNLYWDILRGIAMLLVVLGHAGLARESLLNRAIYAFHMPLFMLISGFFFHFSLQRHSFRENLRRKALQLLLPVLIIGTLYYLITADHGVPLREMPGNYYAVLIRTLWFLQALFLSCLAVLVIHRVFRSDLWRFLACLALCIIFLFVPDFACSTGAKFLFPCFVAGLYLNRCGLVQTFRSMPGRTCLTIVLIAVFGVLLHFFPFSRTFYNTTVYLFSGIDAPGALLFDDIFRVVIGLSGSFAAMALLYELYSRLPQKGPVTAFLSLLGRNTLAFYCIHVYLNELWLYLYRPVFPSSWPYVVLYFLICTAVCLFLTLGYNSLKKFLFPQKKR